MGGSWIKSEITVDIDYHFQFVVIDLCVLGFRQDNERRIDHGFWGRAVVEQKIANVNHEEGG